MFKTLYIKISHSISTGNLLRDRIKNGNEESKILAVYVINSGKLMPDKLIGKILKRRVEQPDCAESLFLMVSHAACHKLSFLKVFLLP